MNVDKMRKAQAKKGVETKVEKTAKPKEKSRRPLTVADAARRLALKPRLPDGTRLSAIFSAERKEWAGVLSVGASDFSGSNSSLFHLLEALDNEYRASTVSPLTVTQEPSKSGS